MLSYSNEYKSYLRFYVEKRIENAVFNTAFLFFSTTIKFA